MPNSDRVLLVVGGGHSEIPLIKSAQALGYEVITTGNRPADRGHLFADRYVAADFSDNEAISRLVGDLKVSAIVSGCNDFAALSSAYAAGQHGLPGHDPFEIAVMLHHKDQFRSLLEVVGLPSPRSVVVRDPAEAVLTCDQVGLPAIVKPVDLTGGKGIAVCSTVTELAVAIANSLAMSRQDHVIVEEFMVGSRHGFTCLIKDGRIVFWFADDEQYFRNEFLVSGTTTPTSMIASSVEQLAKAVQSIAAHLNLVDGLVHVQAIETADGPRIVEVCRRCPGDLYPMFVELATGFDYSRAIVQSETGQKVDLHVGDECHRNVARHCLMAERSGVLRGIAVEDELAEMLLLEEYWWMAGQQIDDFLSEKFGILFFGFSSPSEMRNMAKEFPTRISIDIASSNESRGSDR